MVYGLMLEGMSTALEYDRTGKSTSLSASVFAEILSS